MEKLKEKTCFSWQAYKMTHLENFTSSHSSKKQNLAIDSGHNQTCKVSSESKMQKKEKVDGDYKTIIIIKKTMPIIDKSPKLVAT